MFVSLCCLPIGLLNPTAIAIYIFRGHGETVAIECDWRPFQVTTLTGGYESHSVGVCFFLHKVGSNFLSGVYIACSIVGAWFN